MKKLLVIGIIALFVGLAFIPSFNAVSISKKIEETKQISDESEDDCGCSGDFSDIGEMKENSIIFNELKINIPAEKHERFICVYLVTIQNAWIGVSIVCYALSALYKSYNYTKIAEKFENRAKIAHSKVDYYESLLDKYDC